MKYFLFRYENFILLYKILGHCFRATATTQLVNEGATENQLMQKNGWKHPTMATEYTRNSKPFQRQMAEKLTGSAWETAPPSKKLRTSGNL